MATVVDALVVQLSLDASNFTKGQKDTSVALKKTEADAVIAAKSMQAQGAKAAEFFSAIKTEALSLIGVLVGSAGMAEFAKSTTNSLADLGRQAKLIGESATGIEAFAMAIERAGGNADSARGTLQKFAEAKADFAIGKNADFGIQMGMINGNANTSPLEAIKLFQAYIEKYKDTVGGIEKISAVNRAMFGMDPTTLNSMIQIGTVANLNKELARSYELGTPTRKQIEDAIAFQSAITALGQAAKTTGRNLLDDLYRGLTKTADGLSDLIVKYPQLSQVILAGIVGLTGIKPAMWVLRALGLATVAEGALALLGGEMFYQGTRIGGLNEGEQATIDEYRKAHGLPTGGENSNLTPRKTGNPDQQTTRQAIIDSFIKDGYMPNAAAAIADTVGFETGDYNAGSFNPAGGGMGARGLMNWRGDRIADYVKIYGHAPDAGSAEENIAFIKWEMDNKYKDVKTGLKYIENEREGINLMNKEYTKPEKAYPSQVPMGPRRGYDPGASIRPGPSNFANTQLSSPTSYTIGTVIVQTQATDAPGIAKDFSRSLVTQANRGPQ